MRCPTQIVEQAAELLDLDQPVGLVLVAIYHMVPDSDDPHQINRVLVDALASGSWLVASHLTADFVGPVWDEAVSRLSNVTHENFCNRTRDEFARFFAGLDLVAPGVAPIDDWLHDGPSPPGPDAEPRMPDDLDPAWVNPLWAAAGRKP
ncbi:MAG: SAM-dependent methyltransferase [Acidimicrobiales bacterium]